MEREVRSYPISEVRVAQEDEGAPARFEGYAAVFDTLSVDLGGFREKIEPGAFSDSIAEDDIRALWNHNSDYVLGRNVSDTLELTEDERGLKVSIQIPDTQWARDAMVSIERGDVSQMSFGFQVVDDAWETVDGEEIRTIKKVSLFDVSPVTYPAYPTTEVSVRAIDMAKKLRAEREAAQGSAARPPKWALQGQARERELELAEK